MSVPLSELIKVVHGNGDFSSKLVSLVDREPGATLTKIEGSVPTSERAYSSVQISEDADIELNSDLVYCNHACEPSVIFDMTAFEVRVADRALKKGDEVTFFYPSTEWEMQQPFECHCGSGKCLGAVRGAKYLDETVLKQHWLNSHIEHLLLRKTQIETGSRMADRELGGIVELKN